MHVNVVHKSSQLTSQNYSRVNIDFLLIAIINHIIININMLWPSECRLFHLQKYKSSLTLDESWRQEADELTYHKLLRQEADELGMSFVEYIKLFEKILSEDSKEDSEEDSGEDSEEDIITRSEEDKITRTMARIRERKQKADEYGVSFEAYVSYHESDCLMACANAIFQ